MGERGGQENGLTRVPMNQAFSQRSTALAIGQGSNAVLMVCLTLETSVGRTECCFFGDQTLCTIVRFSPRSVFCQVCCTWPNKNRWRRYFSPRHRATQFRFCGPPLWRCSGPQSHNVDISMKTSPVVFFWSQEARTRLASFDFSSTFLRAHSRSFFRTSSVATLLNLLDFSRRLLALPCPLFSQNSTSLFDTVNGIVFVARHNPWRQQTCSDSGKYVFPCSCQEGARFLRGDATRRSPCLAQEDRTDVLI